jgi:hypothetical protein
MHFRRTHSLLLTTIAVLFLAVPAVASARTKVAVGLGDQRAEMFAHPAFKALKLKKTRFFVRWDLMKRPANEIADAERFVSTARAAGVRVLMHVSTNDLRAKKAKLISTTQYRRDVGRLVRHFRARGVREFGVWNEANHKTQPTYRSASRAAAYYRVMKQICKGCTIVGLDVIDQAGVERYIGRFFNALPRSYRSSKVLVGIHNYSDTNRYRSRGTSGIIRATRKYNRRAKFWLTETGGVVNFGRSFPCSTTRAKKATSYMFTLARQFDRYIDRLYAYNWTGADCNGFDAGLTAGNGSLRPAYSVFKTKLGSFLR